MRSRSGSKALAVVAAVGVLVVVPAVTGLARPAGGIKGDPQPELKPFRLGSAVSDATVATEPNGTLLLAWPVATANHEGKVVLCALARGADSCAFTTHLSPSGGDVVGVPQVIALSNSDVDVVMGVGGAGSNLLFESTDGGRQFGAGTAVGDVGLDISVQIGSDLVYQSDSAASSDELGVFSLTSPGAATTVTPYTGYEKYSALGSFNGGLLAGESDGEAANYQVKVAYEPTTAGLADQSKYRTVADFKNEELLAMSGSALLSQQVTGKGKVLLRLFNGTSWTKPEAVPNYANSGPGSWQVAQDAAGQVDVFSDLATGTDYHLYLTRTSNGGRTWTKDLDLGDAVDGGAFNYSIDAIGAGLVEGGSETDKVIGYPVLAAAHVSIKVSPSTLTLHGTAKVTGHVTPSLAGRKVHLQEERHGRWYTVTTATLSSHSAYTFTIHGTVVGSLKLRVESGFRPGYVEYGYSAPRPLNVHSKH